MCLILLQHGMLLCSLARLRHMHRCMAHQMSSCNPALRSSQIFSAPSLLFSLLICTTLQETHKIAHIVQFCELFILRGTPMQSTFALQPVTLRLPKFLQQVASMRYQLSSHQGLEVTCAGTLCQNKHPQPEQALILTGFLCLDRERDAGTYGTPAYYTAVLLFDMVPMRVIPPLFFALFSYWMIGLHTQCTGCIFTFIGKR